MSGASTLIAKAGNAVVFWPSLTLIWMLAKVPTLESGGVPVSSPVLLLNEAQAGRLAIVKVSVLPLACEAVGVKV